MAERPFGGLPAGIDTEPHRSALHEDDGMMPVLAGYRGGQAEDIPRLAATRHRLEAYRRQVVTFVDDEVTIVGDHVIDFALAHQALNDGDVDDTGRAALAAADLTDLLGREIEKTGEPGEPLVE